MTAELTLLYYSTVLLFVQIMAPATIALLGKGLPWGLSNREESSEVSPMHGRCIRARNNMIENYVMFIALILIANSAGISNETTVLGAQLFFWGRLGHMVTYAAGLVPVRTVAWLIAVIGLILLAVEICAKLA